MKMKASQVITSIGMMILATASAHKINSGNLEERTLIRDEISRPVDEEYFIASLKRNSDEVLNYIEELRINSRNMIEAEGIRQSEILKKYGELGEVFIEYDVPEKFREDIYKIVSDVKYPRSALSVYNNMLKENDVVEILRDEENNVIGAYGEASVYSRNGGWKKTATGNSIDDNIMSAAINEGLLSKLHDPDGKVKLPALFVAENEEGEEIYFVGDNVGPYEQRKRQNKGDGEVIFIDKKKQYYTPHSKRIIDASPALARELGFYDGEKNGAPLGLGNVKVRYITSLSSYIPKK
jgi:hypothetical protein